MNQVIKNRKTNKRWISILMIVAQVLVHVICIGVVVISFRYYEIEKRFYFGAIGFLVSLLMISNLLFYYYVNYKEKVIAIINSTLVFILLIGTGVASYYISKVNSTVNKVIENTGVDQYEVISSTFTYYNDLNKKSFEELEDITDSTIVGVLSDNGIGSGSLAVQLLNDNDIKPFVKSYNTTDDLLSALVTDDDDSVDIAIFPSSYRQRLSNDENVDYSQYLDNIVDFYSFEEKVKTAENTNSKKELTSEPFNVLLIGFAPENEAMTYGLADTIIVATVNPQTFTVSLTSIARDSFVPITCYGGNRDKINASRGASRACLMETVESLLGIEIDYYMEANFKGVVQIVDAIGGITVNNPVEFVGQTASGNRGEYTVWVPAGEIHCDGEMALAFARERHAMPGGDFDRQQHQQEVIKAIAEGVINLRDVNKALAVLEAAGNNVTTNMSISQLSNIFNYIINVKNYTGMSTFNMIDIQNMRVTGYSSWTYNRSMNLPIWIYKLYDGSILEAKNRINDVLNIYSEKDIRQQKLFKYFVQYPYNRGQLYSDYFNENQYHEEMPAFYPYLTKYTYEDAIAWANENGVTLEVTFIPEDSPNFVPNLNGYVVEQYPKQGALVSEYPTGSITVMGSCDPNYVPSYVVTGCDSEEKCKQFADSKGIKYAIEYKNFSDDYHVDGEFAGTNYANGTKIKKNETLIIYIWKKIDKVVIPSYSNLVTDCKNILEGSHFVCNLIPIQDGATEENKNTVLYIKDSSGNTLVSGVSELEYGSTINIYYYLFEEEETPPEEEPTPSEEDPPEEEPSSPAET